MDNVEMRQASVRGLIMVGSKYIVNNHNRKKTNRNRKSEAAGRNNNQPVILFGKIFFFCF
jgi:hypothetical protein